ncbi:hypothetical protein FRB97_000110 [Tulasnella sp. 331]|nr:hypothetical protein FRB97_000110 [Tulasnella sp. 331]
MSNPPSAFLHPASPSAAAASSGRPSSRRALTKALELAQEAVRIDATGDDPQGAVAAYARSVALLNEVMERVMRGDDADAARRRNPSRRKSVVAKEDEARRLRSIHDTYYDRMQILIMIFGIPQPPEITTAPISSTLGYGGSAVPQSRSDAHAKEAPMETNEHVFVQEHHDEETFDAEEGIGSTMLTSTGTPSPRGPEPADYLHYQASSRALPPLPQLTRTTTLPPMRQPPVGPPPIRPRVDSLTYHRQSRLGPPSLPPPMALPPPPLTPQAESHDLSTPLADTYNQVKFARDPFGHHSDEGILNDWEDSQGDGIERLAILEDDGDVGRRKAPPVPRRKDTSESEGSSSRHQNGVQDSSANSATSHQQPQEYHGSSHPYAHTNSALPEIPPEHKALPSRPPTPGNRARGNTQSSVTSSRSGDSSLFSDRPKTPPPMPSLVSTSTAQGTISQRRKLGGPTGMSGGASSASLDVLDGSVHPPLSRSHSPANIESSSAPVASSRLTASGLPQSTATSLGLNATGRHRAASQPGRRPSIVGLHSNSASQFETAPNVPPLPQTALPKQLSFASTAVPGIPRHDTPTLSINPPPTTLTSQNAFSLGAQIPPIPNSPLPLQTPSDSLRRPYHLMNLLHTSIVSPSGGYLTRRLHVPHDVWTQGGAKLNNLVEKGKCIACLEVGLEELVRASHEFISSGKAGNGTSQGLSGQGIAKALADRWIRALDEWLSVCDSALAIVGKKLGIGEGITKKGAGWGTKVTRTFDRMTNGKNLDSPTVYVQNLVNLFTAAQIFDEHHRLLALASGCYAITPPDSRTQIEHRLKRTSDFFVSVVLVFVIRDLGQLMDKFAKKGERWMEE